MKNWNGLEGSDTLHAASLERLAELLALGPDTVLPALATLGFAFLVNDLLRTALMTEGTRSVSIHVTVCTLTLLPALLLAAILPWAAWHHPERAWINLGLAAMLYLPWWLGGALTRLVREDSEGADLGWLGMGALITFPVGLISAVVTG